MREGIVSGSDSVEALDTLPLTINTAVSAAFVEYPLAGPASVACRRCRCVVWRP